MTYYLLWALIPIGITITGLKSNRTMVEVILMTIGVVALVVTLVFLADFLSIPHDKVY